MASDVAPTREFDIAATTTTRGGHAKRKKPAMSGASHTAERSAIPRPDRADKRMVAGYLKPDEFRDFKVVCAKRGLTTDAAVTKAVALLMEDSGAKVPRSMKQRLKALGL